jgi:4'-phosphopantetheinyl transferase
MSAPGWLSQRLVDVPSGEHWLGENERLVLAGLRFARRRADWRLGRWTAKAALGQWLGVRCTRLEVLAAPDGAPEAWLDGRRAAVSISLSHRAGRALAVVAQAPVLAGCDLELVEPRSGAFVREWLAPEEQRLLAGSGEPESVLVANLIWAAKEAAAKVRRQGLRLDVRGAVVTADVGEASDEPWRPLEVAWGDRACATAGWWRTEPGWVMVIAGEPSPEAPRALAGAARTLIRS